MSNLELVRLSSSDKLLLPGLLYTPEKPTKKAAIWLHGMGDSGVFYSPALPNAIGKSFTAKNIAVLAFNNRGAHNSKTLRIDDESLPEEEQRYQGGTYFEKIADCIKDIDGAVAFLREQGYSTFYLLGHSSGANKVCAYHAGAKANPFSKYVLVGPGDDSGSYYEELGKKKFWQTFDYARHLIAKGQSLHIMPQSSGMHPFSAQATADILDPDGDYNTFPYYEATTERVGHKPLFKEYRSIDRPTLVILGEQEEMMSTAGGPEGAVKILEKYLPSNVQNESAFELVDGGDHSFHGVENIFAERVASWLAS